MNAPARIPQGSARITYRGRDQFVARLPRHRSAVWQRSWRHRFVRWLTRGHLTEGQAIATILVGPLLLALIVGGALAVTPS